jgi:hypothetical protein
MANSPSSPVLIMKTARLLLPLLLSACASGGPQQSSTALASSESGVECNVPVVTATEASWRLVQADGFTFCVPASWSPAGRRSAQGHDPKIWRAGANTITWGTGEFRPRRVGSATVRVSVAAGESPQLSDLAVPGTVRRFADVIGGRSAEIWDNQFEGKSYTGVILEEPRRMHISGEAEDRSTAALQLAIYRTIRFAAP